MLQNQAAASIVTVRLTDLNTSAPVAGVMVSFQAPPGGRVTPTSAATSAIGEVNLTLQAPRNPGVATFTASAAGAAPINISLTVNPVPNGNAYVVLARPGSTGTVGGPAVNAIPGNTGWLNSVVAAADGTLYIADENNCSVIRVTPTGVSSFLNTPQPGGSQCVSTGSNGQVSSARLGRPFQVVLDEPRNRLFVSERDFTQPLASVALIRVIDLTSGVISHFAGGSLGGGPGFGDGAPAEFASLGNGPTMALAGDGQGLLVTSGDIPRLRRVAFAPPGNITTIFTPGGCSAATPPRPAGATTPLNAPGLYPGFGIATSQRYPGFVQDPTGAVWFTAGECSRGQALVRLDLPGSVTALARDTFVGGGTFTEGLSIKESIVETGGLVLDRAGNFYVFKGDGTVWRVDGVTGILKRVAGAATATPEYGTATTARLGYLSSAAFDASGTLYVVGSSSGSPNMVWAIPGIGAAQATTATLTVSAGNMQSARVTEATAQPLVATLLDGNGQPIVGAQVEWLSMTAGVGVRNATQVSNAAGQVSQTARPGYLVQSYTLRPRLVTLRGAVAASVDFTVTATAPTAGHAVTLINTERSMTLSPLAMTGPYFKVNSIEGVAVGPSGRISLVTYFGEFFAIGPEGGAQYQASVSTVSPSTVISGVSLDTPRNRLIYCAGKTDFSMSEIRARDLTSSVETRLAGGGALAVPGPGVGGSALLAALPVGWTVSGSCLTEVHPDGRIFVRFATGAETYVIDLAGTITQQAVFIPPVVSPSACPMGNGVLQSRVNSQMFRFDPLTGHAIYLYSICGTSYPAVSGFSRLGFADVNATGGAVLIGAVPLVNGYPYEPGSFAVEGNGDILITTQQDGRVTRIARSNGFATVLMGDGTTSTTGLDFVPATSSSLQFPRWITPMPGGRFLVCDQVTCRTAW